jgi:hypothetical protein
MFHFKTLIMKHTFKLSFLFILLAVFQGCSDDDDGPDDAITPTPSLATTPEATTQNNQSSAGVYKGVLIGSSGTVKIVLQDATKSAIVKIDGTTKTLPTTALNNWTPGQPISNALFSAEGWEVRFSVGANGSNPQVSVNIPGHPNVAVALVKETSTTLVKAFEGTYTGTKPGTLNFVVNGSQLSGIRKANNDTMTVSISGVLQGDSIFGSSGNLFIFGKVSGNTASGTMVDSLNSITWTTTRTL